MIVEVFVDTPLQGKDWNGAITKPWKQIMRRLGINFRAMTPEDGILNRALAVFEWASFDDREKFWNNLPEDAQALLAKRKDYIAETALEHYYYRVVE